MFYIYKFTKFCKYNQDKTPFTGKIKRGKKLLKVKKEGYKTYNIALSKSIEGAFWGNIILGGTLGSLTDFASGAAWAYAPSSFQVELIKDGMSLKEFQESTALKKFAMIHMSDISIELASNNGPYLSSLIELAKLEGSEEDIDLIRKNIEASNGDQVAFGNLMTKVLSI